LHCDINAENVKQISDIFHQKYRTYIANVYHTNPVSYNYRQYCSAVKYERET